MNLQRFLNRLFLSGIHGETIALSDAMIGKSVLDLYAFFCIRVLPENSLSFVVARVDVNAYQSVKAIDRSLEQWSNSDHCLPPTLEIRRQRSGIVDTCLLREGNIILEDLSLGFIQATTDFPLRIEFVGISVFFIEEIILAYRLQIAKQ